MEPGAPAHRSSVSADDNSGPNAASRGGAAEADGIPGPGAAPAASELVILKPLVLDPDILDPVVSIALDGDALGVKVLDPGAPGWSPRLASGSSGIVARLAVALSILAVGVIVALPGVRTRPAGGAIGAAGHVPPANPADAGPAGQTQAGVALRTQRGATEQRNLLRPRLVMLRAPVGRVDEAIPLGLALTEAGQDAALVLSGLPAGAAISTGIALGADDWLMSLSELKDAAIRPPRGFVGAIDLAAELRLADDSVADRLSLRVTWLQTTEIATGVTAPVGAGKISTPRPEPSSVRPPDAPPRQLAREVITDLLRRGKEFMAAGDFGPARLAFRRAAEAGDPEAAFMLATTYDPMLLEMRGVVGVAPDIAMARTWYEKAEGFGSASASLRLQALAKVLASPDR